MEPSMSKKSRSNRCKRRKRSKGPAVPSTLTTMSATPSVAPSTPTQEIRTKIIVIPLSPSTSCSSNTITLSTPPVAPPTPIPEIYDWTHSKITPEEDRSFLCWATSMGRTMADPDECTRFLKWAYAKSGIAAIPAPEEGTKRRFLRSASVSRTADPNEPRRKVLKWPHSTSTIRAPDERWSLQEEISKPFETALKCLQEDEDNTDLKQEHMIYTCKKGMHGVYECQNALWIWPTLRDIWVDGGPREVGKKIKEKFPESDMIKGRPSINDTGYVTIELSGKWIAASIHKMVKAGIDTWAPKLSVERVIIASPSLGEAVDVDICRRSAIRDTLLSILEYSKVDVSISRPTIMPTLSEMDDRAKEVLNRWFSTEERQDMTQDDFDNAYKDLLALWYGLQTANWMIYLTPVWKQEYIEMCFSTAKVEEHAKSDRHKPARTSYAGYRSCSIQVDYTLLERTRAHVAVKQAEDAKLLGYTPKAVVDCVLKYAYLKTHRLAECKLNINDQIFKEEGNTFRYLLNTQAKIRSITDDYREDINELKKASELILGKVEGWEEGEERMLGCRLLEFTEALEESCLSVLPHILCEYLYDLSNKFNRFYFCVCKAGSVMNTSSLLLCEATALVMKKSFHLLGISPTSSVLSDQILPVARPTYASQVQAYGPLLHSLLTASKRRMDVYARDRRRNSRFELFSFLTDTAGSDNKAGKVFGDISVSDKHGLLSSDGESYFFEPDFPHVYLFNHKWRDPIIPTRSGLVYLGNGSSGCSVSVSSSIEVRMELYVAKDEDECYQISNHKIEIDFSDFWEKESDSACGDLTVTGEEGSTSLFYIILKDAVNASLKVKFETVKPGRKVRGYVFAYYGDDFLAECQCLPSYKYHYMSLLFVPNDVLKDGAIQLLKSSLAVPANGSLVIKAYLEDAVSGDVIMKNSCKVKPLPGGSTLAVVRGTDCQFDLSVDWEYPAQYV